MIMHNSALYNSFYNEFVAVGEALQEQLAVPGANGLLDLHKMPGKANRNPMDGWVVMTYGILWVIYGLDMLYYRMILILMTSVWYGLHNMTLWLMT